MSYASVAAKGPVQSLDEKRAPALVEIEHSESIIPTTLVDVDTDSVHTVPANFGSQKMKTETQANRIAREVEKEEAWARADYEKAKEVVNIVNQENQSENETREREKMDHLERNTNDPIFLGNGIAIGLLSIGLGFGAYRRFAAGKLNWKVVGVWTGVVSVLCAVDILFLQWILPSHRRH